MYDSILIGVDEIWLKSEITKRKLLKILIKDIKDRLKTDKIEEIRGRIIIKIFNKEYIEKLKKVFGVKVIIPAVTTDSNLEKIKNIALNFLKDFSGSFKIETRRIYKKFPKTSLEINREIGEYIVKNLGLKVDLKNPQKRIYIEIHKDKSFVSDKKIRGLNGLPLGSEGNAIMLFSGGMDSMVSSILIGKRGINLDFLFINLAGEIMEQYVIRAFEKIKEYFPYSKLYTLDFDVEKFFKVKEGYRQICFKLLIYKIAETFAIKNRYKAIVSGESIGQVSSQTFDSLILLEKFIEIPIFRPLISFNKEEIIRIAKKLNFLEFRAPEVCQLERHSNAHPKEKDLVREFSKLEVDIEKEVQKIREAKKKDIDFSYFIDKFDENLIVVDLKNFEKTRFEKNKKYLIVCPTGLLSYKFVKSLREQGIEAYALDYKTAKRLGYKTIDN